MPLVTSLAASSRLLLILLFVNIWIQAKLVYSDDHCTACDKLVFPRVNLYQFLDCSKTFRLCALELHVIVYIYNELCDENTKKIENFYKW